MLLEDPNQQIGFSLVGFLIQRDCWIAVCHRAIIDRFRQSTLVNRAPCSVQIGQMCIIWRDHIIFSIFFYSLLATNDDWVHWIFNLYLTITIICILDQRIHRSSAPSNTLEILVIPTVSTINQMSVLWRQMMEICQIQNYYKPILCIEHNRIVRDVRI